MRRAIKTGKIIFFIFLKLGIAKMMEGMTRVRAVGR